MDGFLLIDKPAGLTSHDVVAAIRRQLATLPSHLSTRVGHAGTLDPMATGLLIVGIGTATKRLGTLTKLPKTYEAEITLGATSSTDDAEGTLHEWRKEHGEWRIPTHARVRSVLASLTDTLEQVPPAYSAVKVRGVPAYRRARRGERVVLPPRRVTIHAARLRSYRYPRLRVRWTVSSGTYIRALARDLGVALRTGAYLSALRRTTIGAFHVRDAHRDLRLRPQALLRPDRLLRRLEE